MIKDIKKLEDGELYVITVDEEVGIKEVMPIFKKLEENGIQVIFLQGEANDLKELSEEEKDRIRALIDKNID